MALKRFKAVKTPTKPGDDGLPSTDDSASKRALLPTPLWAGICAACLVLGILIGHFVMGTNYGSLNGKLTVDEGDLDRVVGVYVYKGKTYEVTAREAILESSSLSLAKTSEGSYRVPSADNVLAVARNAVLLQEAESEGISASEQDMVVFAENQLGTSDYSSIATTYGMDEEAVKELIRQSAVIEKLRSQVVTTPVGEAPVAPVAPEDGNEEAASADYAAYIIGLAGDEWNSETGKWASENGPYATALKDYSVTSQSATYAAANAAYYVAYAAYSDASTTASSEWTDYVNGLLCEAKFAVSTMVS